MNADSAYFGTIQEQTETTTIITVPMAKKVINEVVMCLPIDLGGIVAEYAVGPMYSADWTIDSENDTHLTPRMIRGVYVTAPDETPKRIHIGTLSYRLEKGGILCSGLDVFLKLNYLDEHKTVVQNMFVMDGSPYGRNIGGDVIRRANITEIACWSTTVFGGTHRSKCADLHSLRKVHRMSDRFPVELHKTKVVSPADTSIGEVQFNIGDYLVMFCNSILYSLLKDSIEWIFEPTPIAIALPQLLEYNTHAVDSLVKKD